MKICEIIILYKDLCSRSIIIAMLSGKNILANLKIWCSKMQPFSGNQRPDPVTSLMNMSPVLNLPRKKKNKNIFTDPLQRCSRSLWLTHSIAFWLRMSFAPQPQAPFEQLNFQKCSEHERFLTCWLQNLLWATRPSTSWTSQRLNMLRSLCICAFWLPNVLRATTGCTFSISHLQQVLWDRGALNILTFKSASRHSRVQFFIPPFSPSVSAPAALASLLLDPPEPQNIGKTACFELSYLFAHFDLLSTDSFSPLTTPAHKLEAWLLYFLRLLYK